MLVSVFIDFVFSIKLHPSSSEKKNRFRVRALIGFLPRYGWYQSSTDKIQYLSENPYEIEIVVDEKGEMLSPVSGTQQPWEM